METIALHTKLIAGLEAEYDRIHRVIPAELDPALREAGVHNWHIWRDGVDVFHIVDVEDYRRMRAFLREHPANVSWQAQMSPLFEITDSYAGDDHGIAHVWSLPPAIVDSGDGEEVSPR